MPLFRLTVIALIIWLLFSLIQRFRRLRKNKGQQQKISHTKETVQCETCGVHLAKEEAITADEHYYCSPQHLPKSGH